MQLKKKKFRIAFMTPINFIAAALDYLNFRSVLPLLVTSYSWWPVLKSNKDKIFSIHASKPFIHPCTDVMGQQC